MTNNLLLFLYHCNLEFPLSKQVQEECYQVLNANEQLQCQTFANPAVQKRFLLSRCLLHHGLSQLANRPPHQWSFIKNEHGKPELEPSQNQSDFKGCLHFNLSHSGNWIAFTFADVAVGVDIQDMKADVPCFKIAKRFFHISEIQKLESMKKFQQIDYFFKLWTLKEAYLKAVGTGLSGGLKSFCIETSHQDLNPFSCYTWKLDTQYMLSIVLSSNVSQGSVSFCNHLAQPIYFNNKRLEKFH